MAVMVPLEVKVADVEPVRTVLRAVAVAAAEFARLSDEEMAALPEAARAGIEGLLAAAQDFAESPGRV